MRDEVIILPGSELRTYIVESLDNALKKTDVHASEGTTLYVAQLLQDFTTADQFLGRKGDESIDSLFEEHERGALSVMYYRAAQLPKDKQCEVFMHIGDYALFATGLYPEQFDSSVVSMHQYQAVGAGSYAQLAQMLSGGVFEELAQKFDKLSEALNIVSVHFTGSSTPEIIKLYSQYISGNEHAKERLDELGFGSQGDA